MAEGTIGSFIAALRKAQGMTQMDVAQRLNVSNKTVSKWERDEGYPEITLIPAIAELFGVTADEILRGGRISKAQEAQSAPARTERQVKRIVASALARFKNASYIAFSLTLAGLICLFTVSYAFYKPILGFGIFLVFALASFMLEALSLNAARAALHGSDIVEDEDPLLAPALATLARLSFYALAANALALVFALPFVLVRHGEYADSVISIQSYLALFPALAAACAVLLMAAASLLPGVASRAAIPQEVASRLRKLNALQGGAIALGAAFPVASLLAFSGMSMLAFVGAALYLLLTAFAIACVVRFAANAVDRLERRLVLLAGVRNMLLAAALLMSLSGISYWHYANENVFHYTYDTSALTGGALVALAALALHALGRMLVLKRSE